MQNIRLQYTSWEELPPQFQALFVQLMGGRAEHGRAFYELYFYWYNIAHELGHVLRTHYGTSDSSPWSEETAANGFAAAYWRGRGETERLSRLRELVGGALGQSAAVRIAAYLGDPPLSCTIGLRWVHQRVTPGKEDA